MWTQHTKFAAPAKPDCGEAGHPDHCGNASCLPNANLGNSDDRARDLLQALREIRHSLQVANDQENGPINDTIWMARMPGCTLFDFIDLVIEGQPQCRPDGRCQYAIDHGAEDLGHCPQGKCVMPDDLMEGLRGMRFEDQKALIIEAAAQAGYPEEETKKKLKPAAWNTLHRVADAAHKAGAKARNEALLRRIQMAMDGAECSISGKVEPARFFELLGVK